VESKNPPKETDMRWVAVCDLRERQAVASATRTRVSTAAVRKIARRIGVGAARLRGLARACKFRSMDRCPGSGRPSKITQKLKTWFLQTSKELGGHWTVRQMADKMRKEWGCGSISVVWRLAHNLGFQHLHMHLRPLLTQSHKEARLAWVEGLLKLDRPFAEPNTVYVHVDEKWFFSPLPGRRVWVAPGEKPPTVPVNSKSHIPKAMFLAAVAKPNAEHDFDGRVGFYPVADRVQAKRDSTRRKKGTWVWNPANMDAARFKNDLKTKVVPDVLRATGKWAHKIIIQMDNAGGHGGGRGNMAATTLAELNAWAASKPEELRKFCQSDLFPVIEFVAQPPRSPDLNILDLGIWASLRVAVDKLKHDKGVLYPTVSEIIQCCQDAWAKWPAGVILSNVFDTLENVLAYIAEAKGGNDYTLLHKAKLVAFS